MSLFSKSTHPKAQQFRRLLSVIKCENNRLSPMLDMLLKGQLLRIDEVNCYQELKMEVKRRPKWIGDPIHQVLK